MVGVGRHRIMARAWSALRETAGVVFGEEFGVGMVGAESAAGGFGGAAVERLGRVVVSFAVAQVRQIVDRDKRFRMLAPNTRSTASARGGTAARPRRSHLCYGAVTPDCSPR